jgi:3-oxoadipate enol-lactonase
VGTAQRSVRLGRTALRYRVAAEGDGEPVLLLHPWFGCPAFWDEIAAGLRGHPILVLDLYSPGEGDWRGVEGPAGLATAVLALLDAEGVGRCALAGNSTGGVAAQIAALLEGIDGAVAVEIEGAGHSPMVDSPGALLAIMQAFLDGREVAGAGRA